MKGFLPACFCCLAALHGYAQETKPPSKGAPNNAGTSYTGTSGYNTGFMGETNTDLYSGNNGTNTSRLTKKQREDRRHQPKPKTDKTTD